MDASRGVEALALAVVLALVLAPWLPPSGLRRRPTAWAALAAACLALGWGASGLLDRPPPESEVDGRPIQSPSEDYVTSRACRACHPSEYASWHASYHRTMTQVATPEAVVSPFDGRTVTAFGRPYRLERRGDEFWVELDDGDGGRRARRVVMTTGSHHMQSYWLAADRSRVVDRLALAYLIPEQRWVPNDSVFLSPPQKHATVEDGRWNRSCIRCHATDGQPRYTGPADSDTHVGEFGIACEACHGPAGEHLRANHDPQRRYRKHFTEGGDPTIVHPGRLTARLSAQVCGQCHAVTEYRTPAENRAWFDRGDPYRPGDDLEQVRHVVHDGEDPARRRARVEADPLAMRGRFWSDGMVRVTGREYNGLLDSPCYRGGEFSCLSCHTMHQSPDDPRPRASWANDQLIPGMDGDLACLQCHESFADDLEEHTRHEPASEGSRCMNCHMPHTTYGLLKAVRSHEVSSPDLAADLAAERPNACNLCHLDRTLAWTSEHLAEWSDRPAPELTADQSNVAAAVLWLLSGDAGQRALAAWHMGWEPAQRASGVDWMPPFLARGMLDPYDAVRFVAQRSLGTLPGYADVVRGYDYVGPRSVRKEAGHEVKEIWTRSRADADGARSELLIDAAGVREADVQRLLERRDRRPVVLFE